MRQKQITFIMKPKQILKTVAYCICICIIACQASGQHLSVIVSIAPQKYFVKRIGGESISVEVLLPAGKSPATFTPTPSSISKLAGANIFFRIGVGFENMIMPAVKSVAPDIMVVDTRENISLRTMKTSPVHGSHAHDAEDDGGKDPHIWMSPVLVKQQILTICNALCEVDPDRCEDFKDNYEEFIKDLDLLHEKLKISLEPLNGEQLFVFHPSFGYFADAYGLKQVAVEIEGKSPKGRHLLDFIKMARQAGCRVVFVQPQFDRRAAQKIAEAIDGVVISLDPLAEDYLVNMIQIVDTIKTALKKHTKAGGR